MVVYVTSYTPRLLYSPGLPRAFVTLTERNGLLPACGHITDNKHTTEHEKATEGTTVVKKTKTPAAPDPLAGTEQPPRTRNKNNRSARDVDGLKIRHISTVTSFVGRLPDLSLLGFLLGPCGEILHHLLRKRLGGLWGRMEVRREAA